MNKQKLQAVAAAFIKDKKTDAAYNSDNWAERKTQSLLLVVYKGWFARANP